MLPSVTFVVVSKRNIKGLLELCNLSLFLNGNGTMLKWTSSLDFPNRRKVMMLFLSSLTGFLKLHIFWRSRKLSLLASLQLSTCPELFHFTVFHWLSVRTVAAYSLQDSGQVSKKLWGPTYLSVLRFIRSHKGKLNASTKFSKTCFELVLFPSARNGRNLSRMLSSLIIIAIKLV